MILSVNPNRRFIRAACLILAVFIGCATINSQQTSTIGTETAAPAERVKLFNDVSGFTPPTFIPLTIDPDPKKNCDGMRQNGHAKLSFVVDQNGRARNVIFEQAIGNDADYLALRILEQDRFNPGELNGASVASLGAMDIRLEICGEIRKDQAGRKSVTLRLRTQPNQVFDDRFRSPTLVADGRHEVPLPAPDDPTQTPIDMKSAVGSVTFPKLIHTAEAEFSDYARANHLQGTGVFSVTVDQHGLPHDIQLEQAEDSAQPLDPSLVQQALIALRQYRFKPATKNGLPVAVRISIEVDFHLAN